MNDNSLKTMGIVISELAASKMYCDFFSKSDVYRYNRLPCVHTSRFKFSTKRLRLVLRQ